MSEWFEIGSMPVGENKKKNERKKEKKKRKRNINTPIENGNKSLGRSSELPGIDSDAHCSDQVCTRKESRVSFMIPICFSFSFFFPINRAPIKQEVKHSSSSFSSTTHPLLIFKYFGDQAVRSIAEETLFRTILTQTWAYAQVAEAKNLTKNEVS